ncbi:hypothetical protein BGW38_004906 [Lunasporangiospora selenospora]|uniref:5-hydroxyisourate hydrolase n=1 Tax=Lunasporangiospora selenospora TaxID=979761 RepID=A0A9P6KHJ6_9FUNG|nr:hypothetical protein BGW38_004906 [Lunasporangiospora selenospora]
MVHQSPITCHVLDSSIGRPGKHVPVKLERLDSTAAVNTWSNLAEGVTDDDGRVSELLAPTHKLVPGLYRMTFQTAEYWPTIGVTKSFFPYVEIVFNIEAGAENQHYHIPLLLSPFSYTTYRGS